MLVNGNAAFEIDGIDQGSRTGWSVIIVGMTEQVTNAADVRRLDCLGLETWTPGRPDARLTGCGSARGR
jgi:hypothetical protein